MNLTPFEILIHVYWGNKHTNLGITMVRFFEDCQILGLRMSGDSGEETVYPWGSLNGDQISCAWLGSQAGSREKDVAASSIDVPWTWDGSCVYS